MKSWLGPNIRAAAPAPAAAQAPNSHGGLCAWRCAPAACPCPPGAEPRAVGALPLSSYMNTSRIKALIVNQQVELALLSPHALERK